MSGGSAVLFDGEFSDVGASQASVAMMEPPVEGAPAQETPTEQTPTEQTPTVQTPAVPGDALGGDVPQVDAATDSTGQPEEQDEVVSDPDFEFDENDFDDDFDDDFEENVEDEELDDDDAIIPIPPKPGD